jgi:predicted nuclease of predicted toxin-antitoxin system
MLAFLADENFNADIVQGLRRRAPAMELLTVYESGNAGIDDPSLLEWAARNQRVLLSHDGATLPDFAYDRVHRGLPMCGVLVVQTSVPVGVAIDILLIYWEYGTPGQWDDLVEYVRQ